jgi:catechol 2,3-dioxygenase-like lactoylglutathione lyase family enzyme
MTSDRFHHLFIRPADFEASLKFYRDTLGWSVTEEWGDAQKGRGVALSGGGVKLVLSERQEAPSADGGARPHVHLDIHDIEKRFKTIPKGAHVVAAPQATKWGTKWFVVRDPDGNLIAFEELHGRD